MMCPRPQVLRKPHRTPLQACPHLRRITQRSRTISFAVPRKHRRQRLRRPRPVRLRPIDGPHASSKHTSVRKTFTEMHLRQKRQVDGPSFFMRGNDGEAQLHDGEPQLQALTHEVAALQRMNFKELRAKFADVCGDETRSGNRAWLIKRIAWRMQANHEGGLTERARQRARELACDADLRLSAPRMRPQPASAPAPPHNPSRCRRSPAFPCPEPSSSASTRAAPCRCESSSRVSSTRVRPTDHSTLWPKP